MNTRAKVWASAAVLPLLTGCPNQTGAPDALIHYHQLGICKTIPSLNYTAPAFSAIVVLGIGQVDNSEVGSSWSLNPEAFLTNPPTACQYNVAALQSPHLISIPANGAPVLNTGIGIVVQTTNQDGSDAVNVDYHPVYGNDQPPSATCQASLNVPPLGPFPVPNHPGTVSVADAPPQRISISSCADFFQVGPIIFFTQATPSH